MSDRSWLRLDCPVCGGWLGLPDGVPRGAAAQRAARRIDAFAHRHRACGRVAR
ncbi:hypothetical protein KZZ52_54060 [Dactylosporangium sp. AC04546]|uniref:hypothetical protein n=1 Tax=Dactylosporangium sp. AC04546 TaxID=2862460 RepID=UPI001EDE9C9C|nr:hypothetical protein [Dactylosporangium sp. AC04546]WVK82782.1 hypothetical protein KZZ52_54060 [Dactylosporangium sp. AC04546]